MNRNHNTKPRGAMRRARKFRIKRIRRTGGWMGWMWRSGPPRRRGEPCECAVDAFVMLPWAGPFDATPSGYVFLAGDQEGVAAGIGHVITIGR